MWRIKDLPRHVARMRLAYAVLLIALTSTCLVFSYSRREVQARQRESFEQARNKCRHTIDLFFSSYLSIQNGLSAYCALDNRLDPEGFKGYIDGLRIRQEIASGMFDVGFILRSKREEREAMLQRARSFKVAETNLARFGTTNTEDFVLIHWQNLKGTSVVAFATHVFTEENRLDAMFRARDQNTFASTDKLDLHVGNNQSAPGAFIIYSPVYAPGKPKETLEQPRENLKGFVFASFFIGPFWEHIFHDVGEPMLLFEVYEGKEKRADHLWYSSSSTSLATSLSSNRQPLFSEIVPLTGLERDWTLYFASTPAFEATPEAKIPGMIFCLGVIVSLALFVTTWWQTQAQRRAEILAGDVQRANRSMAEEKERLSVTLSSIEEGVITLDTAGKVILMNRRAEVLTGWPIKEAQNLPLQKVFSLEVAQSMEKLDCPVAGVLESGNIWRTPAPVHLRARGDHTLLILATICPMRDNMGGILGAVVAFRDMTERQKLLEEQARRSKLESVGLLAGGIAHNFNNVLTAIIGNISLARIEVEGNAAAQEFLSEADIACGRARDLTKQLLTFSKGGAPILKTAQLGDVIRDSSRFVVQGSNVRCEFSLPEDMWAVEADKDQISQVIQNLVINARQAMPEGGVVDLRVQNVSITGSETDSNALAPGRYVKISIQDHGTGIQQDHLSRIFDPYFTTKPGGSGLGLSAAYSIVKRHRGEISVESKPGEGARFDIWLPASDKLAVAPNNSKLPTPQRTGTHRILIMDDEPAILNLLGKMLGKLGYEVIKAADGAEALLKYSEAQSKQQFIDAVIFDLTVPGGMGGAQALKELMSVDPSVRAVVSSGYSNDEVMANFRDYGFQAIMCKPYSTDKLKAVLEQILSPPNPVQNRGSQGGDHAVG